MPILNKTRSSHTVPQPELVRLRIAITAFFALDGFVFAGWVVRIPAVKAQTGASASALGLALLGVSAGAVITMMLAGQLCRRFGNHPMTVACAVLLSLSVALPPLTHSALTLGAVLLIFGAAYGGINVAFNSAAVDLVAALGRPVMPTFHAAFSLGGMLGAGFGGLVAGSLSPARHLFLLTLIGLAVTAAAGRPLLRIAPPVPARSALRKATADAAAAEAAEATEATEATEYAADTADAVGTDDGADATDGTGAGGTRATAGSHRLVVVLGLIALCSTYGEGAMADWGALHLQEDLSAHAGVAAAGYSLFALAMTAGRLGGTRLLERLGRVRTVVLGSSTATAGMFLGSLAPTTWAALIGFAVTGLGLANVFPVIVERAGALAGPGGVATASTLGYGGMLVGPPAIGFMADWWSLPAALTSVAVLAGVAALLGSTAGQAMVRQEE